MTPDQALRSLRAPDQRNMGRAIDYETGHFDADGLAEIESVARTLRAWNPQIIPGPLQTTLYAAGAIKTAIPSLPAEEIQRRAHQRQDRIHAFLERWENDSDVGCAWFVLGESAIADPVINQHAHAAQLEHLLDLSENRAKIQIQVVPDDRPTPGRAGQFSVYGLQSGERLGYLETLVGGWYTTRAEDIARMYAAFSDMIGAALTPADTREYIREALEWWQGSTTEPSSASRATPTQATVLPLPDRRGTRPSL